MKVISTKTHGILDYVMGVILIIAPWAFGFAAGGAETWVPVILGIGTIVYSLLTDYEYGAYRTISMSTHLWLDGFAGLFLAASPWLFGFADLVFWPHLILGIVEIGAVMMTETTPSVQDHEINEPSEQNTKETHNVKRNTMERSGAQTTAGNRMHDSQREKEHKEGIHLTGASATAASTSKPKVSNENDRTRADDKHQPQVNTEARKEQNDASNKERSSQNAQENKSTSPISNHSSSERNISKEEYKNQGSSNQNSKPNPTAEKDNTSSSTESSNKSTLQTNSPTSTSNTAVKQENKSDLPHEKAHADLNEPKEGGIASSNTQNTVRRAEGDHNNQNRSNPTTSDIKMEDSTGDQNAQTQKMNQQNSSSSSSQKSNMDTPSSDKNLSDMGSPKDSNSGESNTSWNKKATTGNRDSQQERNAKDLNNDAKDKT